MRYLSHEELLAQVGDDRKEGELLVAALRRRIIEEKVTEKDLLKYKNFGTKGFNALLEFLELKRSKAVILPK